MNPNVGRNYVRSHDYFVFSERQSESEANPPPQKKMKKWKHMPTLTYFWLFMTHRVAYKMNGHK